MATNRKENTYQPADELSNHFLEGIQETGKVLGNGAYATVFELNYHGLKCAGKKLHELLLASAVQKEKEHLLQRFEGECKLLSKLQHPCIVQFLGIYLQKDTKLPVLVMEYLHTTLSSCLNEYGILPQQMNYGILSDVALGLRYLHEQTPQIVHRDLSANNVLLTNSMNAKISDLGVAKILDLTPAQMSRAEHSKAPGTPCYMPPEALIARPKYTSKIDIYSFGVLAIHVLCGKWPYPSECFMLNPKNPDEMIPVCEVDRRKEYLQEIGYDHHLMAMIRQCLSNNPSNRPETTEIVAKVQEEQAILPALPSSHIAYFKELHVHSTGKGETPSPSRPEDAHPPAKQHTVSTKENDTVETTSENVQSIQPQANLEWKKCAEMPVAMSRPQTVLIGDNVYIGGGGTEDLKHSQVVVKYDIAKDEWENVPESPVYLFGFTQFMGAPVTVGGVKKGRTTGKVYCFKETGKSVKSGKWVEFLKPMPTARFKLSAMSHKSSLVAIGGATSVTDTLPDPCATVEVYNSETKQWYAADCLPTPASYLSHTILSNNCYVVGGFSIASSPLLEVYSCSLDNLIEKATTAKTHTQPESSVWMTLAELPLNASAITTIDETVIALGGAQKEVCYPLIYVYVPAMDTWVKITSWELPSACYLHGAQFISANQVFIAGGWDSETAITKNAFIGHITNRHTK